jgi:hypothetical protein
MIFGKGSECCGPLAIYAVNAATACGGDNRDAPSFRGSRE